MSPLSLDDVVALNALIVTAIGLMLAFGRKGRVPPTLDLSGPRRSSNLQVKRKGSSSRGGGPMSYGAVALQRLDEDEAREQVFGLSAVPGTGARQLNVFFNWNGHTWDAYEVLGIPAGSSRETVIQAFHVMRAKSPDSIAFVQAAADAILKR